MVSWAILALATSSTEKQETETGQRFSPVEAPVLRRQNKVDNIPLDTGVKVKLRVLAKPFLSDAVIALEIS